MLLQRFHHGADKGYASTDFGRYCFCALDAEHEFALEARPRAQVQPAMSLL
jgi:hypothetical protein